MVLAKVTKELVTLVESLGVDAAGISGDGGLEVYQRSCQMERTLDM